MADLICLAGLKKDMEVEAASPPESMVESIVKVGVFLEGHARATGDQTCLQIAELLSKLVAQLGQGAAAAVEAKAKVPCVDLVDLGSDQEQLTEAY